VSAAGGTSRSSPFPLVAVDIGNTRLKLGLFEEGSVLQESGERSSGGINSLPSPARMLHVLPAELDQIADWCQPYRVDQLSWWIGSVQRSFTTRLLEWLRKDASPAITLLGSRDLDLQTSLPRPDMAGVDRLLAAVAANRLRPQARDAVVVDLGTAITVDFVSADGVFQGGAILPGVAMAARALHEFTDLLPLVPISELETPPPAIGNDTTSAMRSGLFWGAVGAVRELIAEYSRDRQPPRIVLTGGAAANVAELLAADAQYIPHLVLAGIALTAART
jgi:type III pantothenate kinase